MQRQAQPGRECLDEQHIGRLDGGLHRGRRHVRKGEEERNHKAHEQTGTRKQKGKRCRQQIVRRRVHPARRKADRDRDGPVATFQPRDQWVNGSHGQLGRAPSFDAVVHSWVEPRGKHFRADASKLSWRLPVRPSECGYDDSANGKLVWLQPCAWQTEGQHERSYDGEHVSYRYSTTPHMRFEEYLKQGA